MFITDTAVRQRTTVFVLMVLLVGAGLYAYSALPREAAPEVVIPNIFVNTSYRGVSPEDMENLVTKEIEEKLKGLDDVESITSTSSEGRSEINIEFSTGVDIDDALQKVKDKVDLAEPELPSDLDAEPSVRDIDFSDRPVYIFAVSGPVGPAELRRLAEDLEEKLEGVPGVQETDVVGGLEREIHVEVDPDRMALYGVPFEALFTGIQSENRNISGGSIRTAEGKYQLRLEGEFDTVKEIDDIVVMMKAGGSPVYLRDISTVVDGYKDRDTASRLDGYPSVTLYVRKKAGENVPKIVDEVKALLLREEATWPAGVKRTELINQADHIREMVSDLENNIITGLLLVIIVVCFAMGLRNAILVSLSIPLSMLIGFAILRMLDVTLNMVVLFSLTLSLGMLVDNAVVIIENIYRFMQQGVPRLEAAMRATSEVAYPIIGSGLTTIAAFFPLLFWTGIMGEFMVYLPTTVITVLGSCLFVALVINPAMAAVLMRKPPDAGATRSADEITSGEDHPMLHEGGIFIKLYRGTLRSALGMRLPAASEVEARWLPARAGRHVLRLLPRLSVLAVALVVFVVAIMTWMYVVALRTPTQFFPEPDPDSAEVSLEVPEGASLEYCDGLVRRVEKRVYDADARHDTPFAKARRLKAHRMKGAETYKSPSDIANVEHSWARVDALQYNNSVSFLFPDFEDRTESSKETIKTIESRLTTFAGAKLTVQEPERGPPTGAPINIEIIGDDLDTLGRIATEVSEKVQKVAFVRNVRDNYQAGAPTLQIRIDRKRAAYLGLGVQSVGNAIRTAISGVDISSYREGDEDYDIVVRLGEAARREITTLRRLAIHSQTHGAVPLTTIAEIRYVGGLGEIHRIDHDRVVTVQADVDTTKTTGTTAKQQAEQLLAGSPLFEAKGIFAVEDGAERFNAVTLPAAAENAFAAIADRAALEAETGEDADHAPLAKALNAIVRSFDPDTYPEATKQLLDPGRAGAPDRPDVGEKVREVKGYLAAADPAPATRQRRNRLLVELAYGEVLQEADEGLELPPGYRYRFTGEDEHQREAGQFLSWAGMVALGLIFLILVAQFDSIIFPFIILSSVILSLTGVFFGLAIYQLPFVIIMTGVGVISLAGVVVNNAIVLIDYSRQLIDRGLERDTALLAAGATRLRPVILTAITTCLGLVPMITGYSVDFHPILEGAMPIFQAASQSSQWWQAMAVAVVFGILVATALTLFVVPVLFSLLDDLRHITLRSARSTGEHAGRMHRLYWRVFTRLTGIQPRPGDPGQEGSGA